MQGAVRRKKHGHAAFCLAKHRLLNPGERRLVARGHAQRGPTGVVRRDGALVPSALLARKCGAHEVGTPVTELVVRERAAHGGTQAAALLAHVLELGGPHEHVGQDMGELLRLRAQRDLGEVMRKQVDEALARRAGHVGTLELATQAAGAGAHGTLEQIADRGRQGGERGVEAQHGPHRSARDGGGLDGVEHADPGRKLLKRQQRRGIREVGQERQQVVGLGKLGHDRVERAHEVGIGRGCIGTGSRGDERPLRARGACTHDGQGRQLPGNIGRVAQNSQALGGKRGKRARLRDAHAHTGGHVGRSGGIGVAFLPLAGVVSTRSNRLGRRRNLAKRLVVGRARLACPHTTVREELRQARRMVAFELDKVGLGLGKAAEDVTCDRSEALLLLRRTHMEVQGAEVLLAHPVLPGQTLAHASGTQGKQQDAQVNLGVGRTGIEHILQGMACLRNVARDHGAALGGGHNAGSLGQHLVAATQRATAAFHAHRLVGAAQLGGHRGARAPCHGIRHGEGLRPVGVHDVRKRLVTLGHKLGRQGAQALELGLVSLNHLDKRVAHSAAGPGDARGEQRGQGNLAQLRGSGDLVGHLRGVRDDVVEVVGVGAVVGHKGVHLPAEGEAAPLPARHDVAGVCHNLAVRRDDDGASRIHEPVVNAKRLTVVGKVGVGPLARRTLGHREVLLAFLCRPAHVPEPHHLHSHVSHASSTARPALRNRLLTRHMIPVLAAWQPETSGCRRRGCRAATRARRCGSPCSPR